MDLVVIQPLKGRHCAECRRGPLPMHLLESGVPVCLDCADLGHLVYLPRGDAALTRRAREASALWAVVVRRNRRQGRYERQGLLVEEHALARAESACLADAQVRRRRREREAARLAAADVRFAAELAARIRQLFPGCPEERAAGIAAHTSARGSGRVGRTAAGRSLEEGAVTAAVRASVRHLDTAYDTLLMTGVPRKEARARLAGEIDAVLASWKRHPDEVGAAQDAGEPLGTVSQEPDPGMLGRAAPGRP
jgi:hypothetical protein